MEIGAGPCKWNTWIPIADNPSAPRRNISKNSHRFFVMKRR